MFQKPELCQRVYSTLQLWRLVLFSAFSMFIRKMGKNVIIKMSAVFCVLSAPHQTVFRNRFTQLRMLFCLHTFGYFSAVWLCRASMNIHCLNELNDNPEVCQILVRASEHLKKNSLCFWCSTVFLKTVLVLKFRWFHLLFLCRLCCSCLTVEFKSSASQKIYVSNAPEFVVLKESKEKIRLGWQKLYLKPQMWPSDG